MYFLRPLSVVFASLCISLICSCAPPLTTTEIKTKSRQGLYLIDRQLPLVRIKCEGVSALDSDKKYIKDPDLDFEKVFVKQLEKRGYRVIQNEGAGGLNLSLSMYKNGGRGRGVGIYDSHIFGILSDPEVHAFVGATLRDPATGAVRYASASEVADLKGIKKLEANWDKNTPRQRAVMKRQLIQVINRAIDKLMAKLEL